MHFINKSHYSLYSIFFNIVSPSSLGLLLVICLICKSQALSEQQKSIEGQNGKDNIKVYITKLKPSKYHENKRYISSQDSISAEALVLEPGRFKNFTHHYQWSTKNKTIYTGQDKNLTGYKFERPDPDTFLKLLVAFDDETNKTQYTVSTEEKLIVLDPINIENQSGQLSILYSELLKVKIKYNGTGPFQYCYSFRLNQTDGSECNSLFDWQETDKNEINISHWLHYVGSYKMVFKVKNIVSQVSKTYSVQIKETFRKKSLPFVPIICSILASVILIIGIAINLMYRRSIQTETADFDWLREDLDEDDEEDNDKKRYDLMQRIASTLFCTHSSGSGNNSRIEDDETNLVGSPQGSMRVS